MSAGENRSIGVFIDGGYYAKINEGLKGSAEVNLKALLSFIPAKLAELEGVDRSRLYVTESHYYRGRYRVTDASDRNLLYSEREFEDKLIENDVIFHYKHLRTNPRGGVIEKGIDTWFALDTYEMTLFRNFDYVVLISGDADHEMLARKLKALKTHVVLLTWDPANTGSTSRFLSEEVCTHIDICRLAEKDPGLIGRLTSRIQRQ
jgi:uncharacterized LabA/DUF88 family protein